MNHSVTDQLQKAQLTLLLRVSRQ